MEAGMDKQTSWLELSRDAKGILIHLKVVPELEQFFKALGDGNLHTPDAYNFNGANQFGRWTPIDGTALEVYAADAHNLEVLCAGQKFRLDAVNQPLEVDASLGYVSNINLSFLRLKGIGSETGVRFLIAGGVMSKTGIYELRDKIIRSIKHIYSEYVMPTRAQGVVYETHIQED